MTLMEQFTNPELINSLTYGERFIGALITTGLGMGITFIILLLIWACIAIMGKVLLAFEKNGEAPSVAAPAKSAATPAAKVTAPAVDEGITPEIVAVITAAIAASQGPQRTDNLVVRRISRAAGERPAWGSAGLSDSIDSRKM